MEIIGSVLALVLGGVFIWSCIGLINPQFSRLPSRVSSVGVGLLSGGILVAVVSLSPQAAAPPAAQTTAETFMANLGWVDMEPLRTFRGRFPAAVFFKPEYRLGGEAEPASSGRRRRLRASFPDGSSILVVLRLCGAPGRGLCVWAAQADK